MTQAATTTTTTISTVAGATGVDAFVGHRLDKTGKKPIVSIPENKMEGIQTIDDKRNIIKAMVKGAAVISNILPVNDHGAARRRFHGLVDTYQEMTRRDTAAGQLPPGATEVARLYYNFGALLFPIWMVLTKNQQHRMQELDTGVETVCTHYDGARRSRV